MGCIAQTYFYTSLAYNLLMHRIKGNPWYSRIDNTVLLGALPFRSQTQELIDEGVRGVVTVNQPHETKFWVNTSEEWASHGVKHLILDTPDLNSVPSDMNIHRGVEFIMNMRDQTYPNNVYVHCKAGRSRSATIVICYIIRLHSCTPREALKIVAECRPSIRILDRHFDAISRYYDNVVLKPLHFKLKNSLKNSHLN